MRTMTFSAVAVATMLSAPVLMFGSPVLADPIHDAAKAGDVVISEIAEPHGLRAKTDLRLLVTIAPPI